MASHRIVVGLDGSAGATAALDWCARFAKVLDAEVVAVTATNATEQLSQFGSPPEMAPMIDDTAIEEAVQHEAAVELEAWCAPLRDAGMASRIYAIAASPVDAVMLVADEVDAHLVVVGRMRHGVFRDLLLGSVSHHLAQHSTRPVVVVPA